MRPEGQPLGRRRWAFVVLLSAFGLYYFVKALAGLISGDWLAATYLVVTVVVAALIAKLVRDFRRYGPDSARFSWRAFFARIRNG